MLASAMPGSTSEPIQRRPVKMPGRIMMPVPGGVMSLGV
jgi:hypothetical protein